MNVQELIYALEELDAPDAEVRFASQPSWPMEYSIHTLTWIKDDDTDDDDPEEGLDCNGRCNECQDKICDKTDDLDYDAGEATIVYLVEGAQIGYLPSRVKRDLGW